MGILAGSLEATYAELDAMRPENEMTKDIAERPTMTLDGPNDARRMEIDTAALADKAIDMGAAGVDALERILALAERERDYRARCAYDDAMLAVQVDMPQIYKDGENTDNRSRFPRLEQVDRYLRPLYTQHGFRITFNTEPCERDGWITHVATVSHIGGHVETIRMPLPIDNKGPKGGPTKTEMHGVGSALSYAQRRLTMQAFGAVATGEDDDGQAAAQPEPVEPVTQEQADEIRQHVLELYVEPAKFLERYSVDTFAGIPAVGFADAMGRITTRRAYLDEHPDKRDALEKAVADAEHARRAGR